MVPAHPDGGLLILEVQGPTGEEGDGDSRRAGRVCPAQGLTMPAGLFTTAVTEVSAAAAQSCTWAQVHRVPGATGSTRTWFSTGKPRGKEGRGQREKAGSATHPQSCVGGPKCGCLEAVLKAV